MPVCLRRIRGGPGRARVGADADPWLRGPGRGGQPAARRPGRGRGRHHHLEDLARRAGDSPGTGDALPRRGVDRVARRRRPGRAVRARRAVAGAGRAVARRRSRSTTTASPTPRCGRCTTTSLLPRSSTASGGTPTSRSTGASPSGRPRSPPTARWSGSTTTSCSSCRRCCASSGPTCASASSSTSRSRRTSCSADARGGASCSRGCSAPTWSASSCPVAPPTSSGWSARGSATRRTATPSYAAGRPQRAGRAFPISIDTQGLEELAGPPGVERAGPEIRAQLGNPRRCCWASTGSTTPRESRERLRAYGELVEEARSSVADAVFVQVATPSRERVEQYRVLRDDIDRLVGRINGDLGRIGRAGVTTCTVLPADGDGRALPRRRRHARDAAARRHEPRRQGVRRLPLRR